MSRLFRKSGKNLQSQQTPSRVENLDELLKLNRGGFSAFAEDTGYQPSYILPFSRTLRNPNLGEQIDQRKVSEMPEPEYLAQDQEVLPEEAGEPDYGQDQDYGQILGDFDMSQMSVPEFLQQLSQAVYRPQAPSTEDLEALYQAAGIPYGQQSMEDGGVRLNTGEVVYRGQPSQSYMSGQPAEPIASMQDGSILWSDGFTRQAPSGMTGVAALSQALFGGQQTVTQEYGNYNPSIYGANQSHLGTDFRTRDLSDQTQYAPTDMQIVERRDNDPLYGNSVLVRLPTGEMMRLSHFDSLGQFAEGDIINSGMPLGVYGSTGRSTGAHLDVELYDAQGQLTSPQQFSAFSNPEVYGGQGSITGISPYLQNQPITPVNPLAQAQPQQPAPQVNTPVSDAIANVVEKPLAMATNTARQTGQTLGTAIEQANPTGQFDLGLSEQLQGQPELAKQRLAATTEGVGQSLGIKEQGVSEAALRGGLVGAARQLAGNLVDTASTPFKKFGVPDTGVSEMIAGGKTVNTDANLAPSAYAYDESGNPVASKKPDYANALRNNLSNVMDKGKEYLSFKKDNALASAGEGIKSLKGLFSNREMSPQMSQIGDKRAVGDVAGASTAPSMTTQGAPMTPVMDTAKSLQNRPLNDNRDPFFKTGQVNQFMSYLQPGAEKGKAFTMDIFKEDIYKEPEKTAEAFRGTSLFSPATTKAADVFKNQYRSTYSGDQYDKGDVDRVLAGVGSSITASPNLSAPKLSADYIKQQYMSKYGGGDYDQEDVQRILASLPADLYQTPDLPEPAKVYKPMPTLQDYLSKGKSVQQWFAETGQQGALDKLQSQGYDPQRNQDPFSSPQFENFARSYSPPSAPAPAPAQVRQMQSYGMNPTKYQTAAGKTVTASPGKVLSAQSDNWVQQHAPYQSPTKDASAQLAPRSSSQPSLFTRLKQKLFGGR
jgi:murein DD-endopeptidase MepM/ murein hydrolase activator NlpD